MRNSKTKSILFSSCISLFVYLCFTTISIAQQHETFSTENIETSLYNLISKEDNSGILSLSEEILNDLIPATSDSTILSELYYYAGICQLLNKNNIQALPLLQQAVDIKSKTNTFDDHYAKGMYNIGVIYNDLGDYDKAVDLMLIYIKEAEKLYGTGSSELISAYTTIIGASLERKDYDKFREYTLLTLEILNSKTIVTSDSELSSLYTSIGAGYGRLSDYAKARIYFEEAESILNRSGLIKDENYINLINNLAIIYGRLGLTEKEEVYYEKGFPLAENSNSFVAYNFINSFAIALGNKGDISRGKKMLSKLIERAQSDFGTASRYYYEVIKNYAEFLRIFMHDTSNSLKYYTICLDYIEENEVKTNLRDQVMTGYALALSDLGEYSKALDTIQALLYADIGVEKVPDFFNNPSIEELKPDNRTLNIVRTKYEILWKLFSESDEFEVLVSAARTSEIVIDLIDKIRINITEEESRIILGDNYRQSYLNSIHDFELCFKQTGELRFLDKVFEYSEKSKVAGLLAATRELNAINFHIPQELAEYEKSLSREIAYYNSRISNEKEIDKPDEEQLLVFNNHLLTAIGKRDSLIITYERDYPEYFNLKYNNIVPLMEDVPSIIGRNRNYLSYVVSDSVLFILLVNRKYQLLTTVIVDSAFIDRIINFRDLLSNPDISQMARSKFNSYQETGYYLYTKLIEPVHDYFVSSDLLISPDNILSYIPFETILSSTYDGSDIIYRKLPYLMNDYNISYVYSVSFTREAGKEKYRRTNNLVAFAPMYTGMINLDSLLVKRQTDYTFLDDLPFARQEAEYVAQKTNGILYLNDDARESVYKAEAEKYDILHLAMHTYLNDKIPMNSAMIFSQVDNDNEDGLLRTFEVYGIPLKAKMVVLSSCNTGSGTLSSGEGILSLARGFLYSGSQSVIMSMWEIEDQSGTEIIKLFYDNLLKGKSKSAALKNARNKYLSKSNQLKSHPYFWSSLVIYGDDNAVYSSRSLIIIGSVILFLCLLLIYYVWKRKYS